MNSPPFRRLTFFFVALLAGANVLKAIPQSDPPYEMKVETANDWALLVLAGVDREFPNKPSVVLVDESRLQLPREMFPAFFGCFDWHSSVHGHWLLVRLVNRYPEMESADRIREILNRHLSAGNIEQETAFFSRDEHKSFERMYGWAWYLRLVAELHETDTVAARELRENLRPLEELLVRRIREYLPLLEFPVRTGEHPDTGFALGQIMDYATIVGNDELRAMMTERARAYFLSDQAYPMNYEPSGQDFFSSGWNEADLMRRVLPPDEFATWLADFLPELEKMLVDGTINPVRVSDQTDGKLVHLAGLNLNRAWCMAGVAAALSESDSRREAIINSAKQHLTAGLEYVNSGHYEGDHWLATFGLYALSELEGIR